MKLTIISYLHTFLFKESQYPGHLWRSSSYNSTLSIQVVWVPSLVEELRSHVVCHVVCSKALKYLCVHMRICVYIYIVNTLINIKVVIKNMIFEYQMLGHNYSRNLSEVGRYLHLHRLVLNVTTRNINIGLLFGNSNTTKINNSCLISFLESSAKTTFVF